MENEQIVKKEPLGGQSFIERLVEKAGNLEDIKKVGDVIISSGFCPDHFKQSKDSVGVIMCIEAGKQLGMSWMQSLSDLYPVKGRIGMMGDAAVALILGSGVLEYWKEETTGTYPQAEYTHIIRSKRKGWPNENVTEFSVFDAQKAGLMDKEIYRKYGKRMLGYRAKGFHARDFYSDIMRGLKTVEELSDYDPGLIGASNETHIITADGQKLKIDPKKGQQSESISQSVVDKIDKANGDHKEKIEEAQVIPQEKEVTEESLSAMGPAIYEYAAEVLPPAKIKILESLGKKSNKRYTNAIMAFKNGKLDEWLQSELLNKKPDETPEPVQSTTPAEKVPPVNQNVSEKDDMSFMDQPPKNIPAKEATASFESQANVQGTGSMFPEEPKETSGGIEIPEIDSMSKQRTFPQVIKLHSALKQLGMDDDFSRNNAPGGYPTLEKLCKFAPKAEIEGLILKLK